MTDREIRDAGTLVCLGRIGPAHGIAGEVVIKPFCERPEDIASYGPLRDESGRRSFEIRRMRVAKKGVIAALSGVSSRAAAEALGGFHLYVLRAALPEPDAGAWYITDLIGLGVRSPGGDAIGEVVGVQNFGAGDLLEIRPEAGGPTVLVPFTREHVPNVDVAGRVLIVDADDFMDGDRADPETPA